MRLKGFISYGWLVWSLGTAFYLYQFVLRASPSVMADHLMADFFIQASSLGILSSSYYYAYTLFQIPIGISLDRIGPKYVARFSILICTAGALIFSFSHSLGTATFGRILIGAGASGAFLSTITLARHWLPAHRVAFAVGTTIAFGKLGGVLAGAPLATLVHSSGWRESLFFLSLFGIILGIAIWFFLKNNKDYTEQHARIPIKKKLSLIFSNSQLLCVGIYGCLMYVPLSVFTDIWGVSFLMKNLCVEKPMASLGVSLVFVGTALGAPLIALWSDKIRARRPLMLLSALASLVVCTLLIFIKTPLWICFPLLFLMGLFMTGQTLVFAVGAEMMPSSVSGVSTGFVNSLVMTGGVMFQPLVGFLLDFLWDGRMCNDIPVYTLSNYQTALSIIPLCMLISLLILFLIPETYKEKSV